MLASIRASGGIGGGRLKRVSSKDKRDRSAAAIPGAPSTGAASSSNAPTPAAGGGLADALAAALSQRNKKVSASGKYFSVQICCRVITVAKLRTDDEDDGDDWDDPPKRK